MIDVEAVHQHGVLGGDHVVIVVLREVHAQAIGRLARFAVADVVGKNDVEPGDVEGLAGPEEHVGKDRVKKRMRVPPSSVQQQDRVIGMAGCIAMRLTQREVVEFQLRDRFTATEVEILDDVVAVLGWPVAGLSVGGRTCKQGGKDEAAEWTCQSCAS